jgi:transcriptional regulator
VVPTWNYISIQATGPLSVMEEKEWLLRHVNELTDHKESGRSAPWSVADAPAEFIEQMCSGIVGLSLQVRTLEGAWKMAQHKPETDRLGVIRGLNELDNSSAQSVASEMLRLEGERSQ